MKNTRMDALIVKEITQLKNAQLGRLLVSYCQCGTTPMGSQESLLRLAGHGVVRRADQTDSTQFVYLGSGREDA